MRDTMTNNCKPFFFIISILVLLNGCAAAVIGGGATAAAVATDRRTTGTVVEDQAIELKVSSAISEDPELDEKTHINITSYNTYVLVTGEAPTQALRDRVINIVKNTDKVTHVYDEIAIAAPTSFTSRSNDALLSSKLKSKMFADEYLAGIHIKVVTERGTAYLMGLVTRDEADRATEIARKTAGLQKVVKLFLYQ